MKNSKKANYLKANMLFVLFTILTQQLLISSVRVGLSSHNMLRMSQEEANSTPAETVPVENQNNTETNATIASNVTDPAAVQANTTEASNTNITVTLEQNVTETVEPEEDPEIVENLEENNKKIEQLEKAVKDQGQMVEDVKGLLKDVNGLSEKLNEQEKQNMHIVDNLKDIRELYQQLDFQMKANSVQTENQLRLLNEKVADQLNVQLDNRVYDLEKEIQTLQVELIKINDKIKSIKQITGSSDSICNMFTSCSSCSSRKECGWCSMTDKCVDGDAKGPLDGSCTFYDYDVCSGPKECETYSRCDDCIKDISCGWCNNPSQPICMNLDDFENGKQCDENRYVHLWKSLNICPHNKNYKALGFEDNATEKTQIKEEIKLDPMYTKSLIEELKDLETRKIEHEVMLQKLMNALQDTQDKISILKNDKKEFVLMDQDNTTQNEQCK